MQLRTLPFFRSLPPGYTAYPRTIHRNRQCTYLVGARPLRWLNLEVYCVTHQPVSPVSWPLQSFCTYPRTPSYQSLLCFLIGEERMLCGRHGISDVPWHRQPLLGMRGVVVVDGLAALAPSRSLTHLIAELLYTARAPSINGPQRWDPSDQWPTPIFATVVGQSVDATESKTILAAHLPLDRNASPNAIPI